MIFINGAFDSLHGQWSNLVETDFYWGAEKSSDWVSAKIIGVCWAEGEIRENLVSFGAIVACNI